MREGVSPRRPSVTNAAYASVRLRTRRGRSDAARRSPNGGRRMSIIGWVVFGLIVGVVAKLLMPGRDPGSSS